MPVYKYVCSSEYEEMCSYIHTLVSQAYPSVVPTKIFEQKHMYEQKKTVAEKKLKNWLKDPRKNPFECAFESYKL